MHDVYNYCMSNKDRYIFTPSFMFLASCLIFLL